MKKGFTLVELLAVIVVLAIISLIVVPIILNIISTSQEGANLRSVEGYAKTLEISYYKEKLINSQVDINDIEAEYNGARVDCQIKIINNQKLELKQCKVDNSEAIYGYINGKAFNMQRITDAQPTFKIYKVGDIVYFDPVTIEACNEETFNIGNIKKGTSTCYKWRVIETNDSNTKENLIIMLDHNLVNNSPWTTTSISMGPVSSMTALTNATSTWKRVNPLTYTYDTNVGNFEYGEFKCVNGTCTFGDTTINNVVARMITGEEVAQITNTVAETTWVKNNPTDYYFSNDSYVIGTKIKGTGNLELSWLIENTSSYNISSSTGSTENAYGNSNYGYWSLTPYSNQPNEYIFGVYSIFGTYYPLTPTASSFGIRPVITTSKTNLS